MPFNVQHDSRDHLADYMPTPEEIRRECEAIQAGWSPEETRRRAPWAYASVDVHVCELAVGGIEPGDAPAAALTQEQLAALGA